MSELKLTYRRGEDVLEGQVSGAAKGSLTSVQREKVTLRIDRHQSSVVSFEVAGFRHFVGYHLLAQLFGDEAIRKISAFQADAVAGRAKQKTIQFEPPHASHGVVNGLLKAA